MYVQQLLLTIALLLEASAIKKERRTKMEAVADRSLPWQALPGAGP
jgi:hypothetical protein